MKNMKKIEEYLKKFDFKKADQLYNRMRKNILLNNIPGCIEIF